MNNWHQCVFNITCETVASDKGSECCFSDYCHAQSQERARARSKDVEAESVLPCCFSYGTPASHFYVCDPGQLAINTLNKPNSKHPPWGLWVLRQKQGKARCSVKTALLFRVEGISPGLPMPPGRRRHRRVILVNAADYVKRYLHDALRSDA